MKYIKKIVDLIKRLELEKFTGVLIIKIFFNQGGIRDAKKNLEDNI